MANGVDPHVMENRILDCLLIESIRTVMAGGYWVRIRCPTCHSNVRCCLNPWHDALPAQVVKGLTIIASAPDLADTMIQFSNALADRDEILQKYIKAMDAIYNSGEAGRKLVIKHFGTVHDMAQPDAEKE